MNSIVTPAFSGELSTTKSLWGDRFEVRAGWDDCTKKFTVLDRHQSNVVVGTYLTFKQASIEAAFLSLIHMKSLHLTRLRNSIVSAATDPLGESTRCNGDAVRTVD